jgi:hypothetical protein
LDNPDSILPVFPWNEEETGEQEETVEFPLWPFRSRRRWWRTNVRLAASFAVLALCVLELHDYCADDARISDYPTTLRTGVMEAEELDNDDVIDTATNRKPAARVGRPPKNDTTDEKKGPTEEKKRGRPRKEEVRYTEDDTETEDEGTQNKNDDDTEDEAIVVPKNRSSSTTTGKAGSKKAVAMVISSDDEDTNGNDDGEEEDDEHDDYCYLCDKPGSGSGLRQLLLCEGCSTVVHVSCAGFQRVPADDWFCN